MTIEDMIYNYYTKKEIESQKLDPNGETDMFKPPKKSRMVHCLHCDHEYQSSKMVYEARFGDKLKFWYCADKKCPGKGYGFDIHDSFLEL